jgi:hypothetical protein
MINLYRSTRVTVSTSILIVTLRLPTPPQFSAAESSTRVGGTASFVNVLTFICPKYEANSPLDHFEHRGLFSGLREWKVKVDYPPVADY